MTEQIIQHSYRQCSAGEDLGGRRWALASSSEQQSKGLVIISLLGDVTVAAQVSWCPLPQQVAQWHGNKCNTISLHLPCYAYENPYFGHIIMRENKFSFYDPF